MGRTRGAYRDETDAGGVAGSDGGEAIPGAEDGERWYAGDYTHYRDGGKSSGSSIACSQFVH